MNQPIALSLALFFFAAPAVLAAPKAAPDRCWIEGVEFDPGAPGVVIYGSGRRPKWSKGVGDGTHLYVDLQGEGGGSCFLKNDHAQGRKPNHRLVKRIRYAPNRLGVVRVVIEASAPSRLGASFKAIHGGWVLRLPVIREGKLAKESPSAMPWKREQTVKAAKLAKFALEPRFASKLPAPPRLRAKKLKQVAASPKPPHVPLEPFIPSLPPRSEVAFHAQTAPMLSSLVPSGQVLSDWLLDASPRTQTVPYQGDRPKVRVIKGSDGQIRIRLEGMPSVPTLLTRSAGVAVIEQRDGEVVVSFRSEGATTSMQANRSIN